MGNCCATPQQQKSGRTEINMRTMKRVTVTDTSNNAAWDMMSVADIASAHNTSNERGAGREHRHRSSNSSGRHYLGGGGSSTEEHSPASSGARPEQQLEEPKASTLSIFSFPHVALSRSNSSMQQASPKSKKLYAELLRIAAPIIHASSPLSPNRLPTAPSAASWGSSGSSSALDDSGFSSTSGRREDECIKRLQVVLLLQKLAFQQQHAQPLAASKNQQHIATAPRLFFGLSLKELPQLLPENQLPEVYEITRDEGAFLLAWMSVSSLEEIRGCGLKIPSAGGTVNNSVTSWALEVSSVSHSTVKVDQELRVRCAGLAKSIAQNLVSLALDLRSPPVTPLPSIHNIKRGSTANECGSSVFSSSSGMEFQQRFTGMAVFLGSSGAKQMMNEGVNLVEQLHQMNEAVSLCEQVSYPGTCVPIKVYLEELPTSSLLKLKAAKEQQQLPQSPKNSNSGIALDVESLEASRKSNSSASTSNKPLGLSLVVPGIFLANAFFGKYLSKRFMKVINEMNLHLIVTSKRLEPENCFVLHAGLDENLADSMEDVSGCVELYQITSFNSKSTITDFNLDSCLMLVIEDHNGQNLTEIIDSVMALFHQTVVRKNANILFFTGPDQPHAATRMVGQPLGENISTPQSIEQQSFNWTASLQPEQLVTSTCVACTALLLQHRVHPDSFARPTDMQLDTREQSFSIPAPTVTKNANVQHSARNGNEIDIAWSANDEIDVQHGNANEQNVLSPNPLSTDSITHERPQLYPAPASSKDNLIGEQQQSSSSLAFLSKRRRALRLVSAVCIGESAIPAADHRAGSSTNTFFSKSNNGEQQPNNERESSNAANSFKREQALLRASLLPLGLALVEKAWLLVVEPKQLTSPVEVEGSVLNNGGSEPANSTLSAFLLPIAMFEEIGEVLLSTGAQ